MTSILKFLRMLMRGLLAFLGTVLHSDTLLASTSENVTISTAIKSLSVSGLDVGLHHNAKYQRDRAGKSNKVEEKLIGHDPISQNTQEVEDG